jgi:hypothetical protein
VRGSVLASMLAAVAAVRVVTHVRRDVVTMRVVHGREAIRVRGRREDAQLRHWRIPSRAVLLARVSRVARIARVTQVPWVPRVAVRVRVAVLQHLAMLRHLPVLGHLAVLAHLPMLGHFTMLAQLPVLRHLALARRNGGKLARMRGWRAVVPIVRGRLERRRHVASLRPPVRLLGGDGGIRIPRTCARGTSVPVIGAVAE